MKTIYLFITGLLIATTVFSQSAKDVVYLKNGSMIKGSIIEQVPNEQIKIKTKDGSIFVYKSSDIEKIKKEKDEVNLDEYGGRFSYGIAIGGGGIVGIPVRAFISKKFAMELGAFYRPAVVLTAGSSNSSGSFNSIVFAGGTNYYFKKYYKDRKQKIKINGITAKAGIGFGDFSTYLFGAAWIHESFKKRTKNRSFSIELGPGVVITDNLPASYYEYTDTPIAIYWKLMWSLHSK